MWRRVMLAACVVLGGCDGKPAAPDRSGEALAEKIHRQELQKTCADQAEKAFQMAGTSAGTNLVNSYKAHYSFKLRHCFMLVHSWDGSALDTTGTVNTFESLQEPFEGKNYGAYFQSHETKHADAFDHYLDCHISPPGQERTNCFSEEEWRDLVNRYMRD